MESPNNLQTTAQKSTFFPTILAFCFSTFITFILLISIDIYLANLQQSFFTPRSGFSINTPLLFSLGKLTIWLIPVVAVFSLITHLIAKIKILSKITVGLLLLLSIGAGLALFIVSGIDCEGLGCIGIAFALLFAESSWLISGGAIPVLLVKGIREESSLLKNKTFWGVLILTSFMLSVTFFISSLNLQKFYKQRTEAKTQELEKVDKDPSIPVFEPEYLPPGVTELTNERVTDNRNTGVYNTNPTHLWEREWNNTLKYERTYLNNGVSSFIIEEHILGKPIDNFLYRENDFVELQQQIEKSLNHPVPEFRKPNIEQVEKLTIDDSPALFYFYYSKPYIHVYKDGVKIKIFVLGTSNQISKEELIKVAKSLKRIK